MTWITQNGQMGRMLVLLLSSATIFFPSRLASAQGVETTDVYLHAPKSRPGCNDQDFFLREFQRALGPRQLALTQGPRIDLRIEEVEPDAFELELLITPWRKAPIRIPPRLYGPATECSKVLAYAADIAATVALPPEPTQPKVNLTRERMDYVIVGTQATYGLSPQLVRLSPFITGGVPLSSKFSVELSLSFTPPYSWVTDNGKLWDIGWSPAVSIALCYQWGIAGLCPIATFGGFNGTAPYIQHPVDELYTYYLTGGIELYAEKHLSPNVALRVEGVIAGTSIAPGLQIGKIPDWIGAPITTTLKGGLMFW